MKPKGSGCITTGVIKLKQTQLAGGVSASTMKEIKRRLKEQHKAKEKHDADKSST